MYTVIARKYRPQTFSEVVNQEHIKQTLRNAIEQQRIAHGYIFAGQRGTGKTTMARLLAKALNCRERPAEGPVREPCLKCESCREVAAGNAVDVIEIDAASNRGIDDMRSLRENARYAASRDRYKFFIIDEAHQLTKEAWNALLKTLEEPPPHVIFVLCTTEAHAIPSTISSRCQTFIFHNLGFEETVKQLQHICASEGIEASEDALAVLTQAADGSLRDALSSLDQAIACCGEKLEADAVRQLLGVVPAQALEEVIGAVREQAPERMLALVDHLVREGQSLRNFCGQLSRQFRNLLVVKTASGSPHLIEASRSERDRLQELAGAFSEEDLARYLQIVLRLYQDLHHSPQPRFHTELGLLKLVHAQRLAPIEDLLAQVGGASTPGKAPPPSERAPSKRSAEAAAPSPPAPRAKPGSGDDLADELISRVENMGRMMLGISLERAVSWDVGPDSVVASFPAGDAGVHLPTPDDQRLLANLAGEVLGRPVTFRAAIARADHQFGDAAQRVNEAKPIEKKSPAQEGAPTDLPGEVADFLRLFPGSAIEEQRRKG